MQRGFISRKESDMVKVIASTAVVVLLIGSATFGSVDSISNIQQFSLTLSSHLTIQGPSGLGVTSLTIPNLLLAQTAGINSGQTTATQGIGGTIGQAGHDATWGGVNVQELTGATAGPAQTPSGSPVSGSQSLDSANGSNEQGQISVTWGSLPLIGASGQSSSLLVLSIPKHWLAARPVW
jgi:hypothetical protein